MKVLIIIPAYNEENNILSCVNNLKREAPDVDYIIVNDCSKDKTRQICEDNNLNYLDLPVNLGIGGAVQAGYLYAFENGYDITIQMDGDGQHDPAYISDVIQPIIDGQADMVIGSRFITKEGFQSSFMRRFGSKLISGILKLCGGIKVYDTTSGFRASSKELTQVFSKNYAQDYPEPEAILTATMSGFKVCEVPVKMKERQGGKSSINALKSINYMIKVPLSIVVYKLGHRKGR